MATSDDLDSTPIAQGISLSEHDAELLQLARHAARSAGRLIARYQREGVQIEKTKSSSSDIVTEADRAAEALIRRQLRATRPADAIVGEEEDDQAGHSGLRWFIDPIDGTVNYAHRLPNYAVSIGVELEGIPHLGVVYNPASGQEFYAVRGAGAWCNGQRLQAARPRPWVEALVATGFSYEADKRAIQAEAVRQLLPQVGDIRRMGSCALDLCMVATGQLDAYAEDDIGGPWDYAAGQVIANEAGAHVEILVGATGGTLVVAAPQTSYSSWRSLVVSCGFAEF